MNVEKIKEHLATIPAPGGAGDVVVAGIVSEVELTGGEVLVVLKFEGTARPERHKVENAVRRCLVELEGIDEVIVEIEVADMPEPQAAPKPEAGLSQHGGAKKPAPKAPKALGDVKNIIAVASGKGGVGKSTVAVNLALALAAKGARVGICDIDIYGPSVPMLLGVPDAKPAVTEDQKRFKPIEVLGLKVMSIGFLVDDDTPVIWRGPIVNSVVKQFLEDVEWGELDYLVMDMPPGTGDAQLTLTQSAPITGAIVVTTPSELALIDAVKGMQMFRRVDTPVLGLVENMSHYTCVKCGHESHIFNKGGTERVSERFDVNLLGQIPIDIDIQRGGDTGKPIMHTAPEGPQAQAFLKIAEGVMAKVPLEAKPEAKAGFLSGLFGR